MSHYVSMWIKTKRPSDGRETEHSLWSMALPPGERVVAYGITVNDGEIHLYQTEVPADPRCNCGAAERMVDHERWCGATL